MDQEQQAQQESEGRMLHDKIMNKYKDYLGDLSGVARKEGDRRDAKRVAVTVSLWDHDDKHATAHMFEHTLKDLYKQAAQGGFQLDVFMVANNSGGPTDEIAQNLEASVTKYVNELAEQYAYIGNEGGNHLTVVDAVRPPTAMGNTEANEIDIPPLTNEVDENSKDTIRGSRFFYIKQARDTANDGKIRAIRDISAELYDQMVKNGYKPDALLQIDAESFFEYSELNTPIGKDKNNTPLVARTGIPPLKVMLNNLMRADIDVKGKSGSDRSERIDPASGLPTNEARPAPYTSFFLEKKEYNDLRLLAGGSMLVRPEVYVAGMKALSETLPGVVMEDIAFSKILLEHATEMNPPDPEAIDEQSEIMSVVNMITYLNRVPAGKGYLEQMKRWVQGRRAVETVFPEREASRNREGGNRMLRFLKLVARDRIVRIAGGDLKYAKQIWRDITELPGLTQALKGTGNLQDLFQDEASFTLEDEKK